MTFPGLGMKNALQRPNPVCPMSAEANRGHWVIENSCHYILDWTFDEDRSRIRTGDGPRT